MKNIFLVLLIIFCFLSCQNKKETRSLHIAVASNMQFAMDQIKNEFSKQTGIACNLIVNSSGKLTSQIENGAPFDLFLSADLKYPQYLYEKKLCEEKPKIYAYGKLALWTKINDIQPNIQNLNQPTIKNIAIANPHIAPYGKASIEALKKIHSHNSIQHKFIYGESIGQVNQFIQTKAVDLGFTSISSILSLPLHKQGQYVLINPQLYTPLEQGIVILNTPKTKQAQMFYDFVFSTSGKKILQEYGYDVP